MTDDPTLRQALAYARRGWPVFPCQPGQKIPATPHGYRDATTDPEQITAWFSRHPGLQPGHRHRLPRPRRPGRRPARPGRRRVRRAHPAPRRRAAGRRRRLRPHPQRRHARLLHRHPQRNGHLPAHHLDFRSPGGYVLAPPSQVGGKPYRSRGEPPAAAAP